MNVRILPSILSADFGLLAEAVRLSEEAGADMIHVDIMDGHFVPNLTFGPGLVASLKKKTELPLNVHLMVDNPHETIPLFLDAGADWLSFHVEATPHVHREIALIKHQGCRAGVALNPATPLIILNEVLQDLDFVLLMTVNPGRGSQEFIESSLDKIARLRQWITGLGLDTPIEIDGGVHPGNLERLIKAGAELIVAGSAIFKSPNPAETIRRMKDVGREAGRP